MAAIPQRRDVSRHGGNRHTASAGVEYSPLASNRSTIAKRCSISNDLWYRILAIPHCAGDIYRYVIDMSRALQSSESRRSPSYVYLLNNRATPFVPARLEGYANERGSGVATEIK